MSFRPNHNTNIQNQYVITVLGKKASYDHHTINVKRIRVVENYIEVHDKINELIVDLKEVGEISCERFRSLHDMNLDRAREIIKI